MLRTDNVLLTVEQIIEVFGLSAGRVRLWIAAGKLKPIRRAGRGRSGMMFFARGEVSGLVFGRCSVCGDEFKKAKDSQKFCGKPCRQKSSRMKGKA
jgi:hypothetical protein